VANQIDLICALQLISAEGPLAAQIGGSRAFVGSHTVTGLCRFMFKLSRCPPGR
jgi:hypothetical protein